jgi:hypothetical protein
MRKQQVLTATHFGYSQHADPQPKQNNVKVFSESGQEVLSLGKLVSWSKE